MDSSLYRPRPAAQPTPAEVAQWIDGTLAPSEAAPPRLTGFATLATAEATDISFVASPKVLDQARESRAGLLIVPRGSEIKGRACVAVESVWAAVAGLLARMFPQPAAPAGVHPTAVVSEDARIAPSASVGPCCVVGAGASVGERTVLGPHCIVEAGCTVGADSRLVARVTLTGIVHVGDRVLIHPGAVLGADGFKFEPVAGRPLKIPQVGAVIIEDDVEIGANTTIDRAFLHETRICRGAKIDNLVQIAHNVRVGRGSILASQVGIAGSTRLGAGCLVGGAAGFADNITVGDGVNIGGFSAVYRDFEGPGEVLMGYPARPQREFWRIHSMLGRLPELARALRQVEMKLEKLESGNHAVEE